MGYAFREAVNYCHGCDYCYFLYWYFECDECGCHYRGHFDSRDMNTGPDWFGRVTQIERCYTIWAGYCPDTSWGYFTDPSHTPRENEEAEEAALWLSGSLVAPPQFYDVLCEDLPRIRAEFRATIPQVDSVAFQPRLVSNNVALWLTADAYQQYLQGEYHDWDSLNTRFGLTRIQPGYGDYAVVHLIFAGRYNTPELANVYKKLSTVGDAWPGDGWSFLCDPSTIFAWRIQ